ncbi:MAG: hypothetical protein JO222_09140 [Frankiales bacterium]|nr:hypothetical protein [Frankiales bacterium]
MFEPPPSGDPARGMNPRWLFGSVTERLEWVLEQEPSADTWEALLHLQQCTLQPAERILLALAWERQHNAAGARMHSAVADATTVDASGPVTTLLEVEYGLASRRSDRAVQNLTAFAHRLVELMPVMHRMIEVGDASLAHARVLDDFSLDLDEEQTERLDSEVSPQAATLSLPSFRRAVRKAVAAIDADAARRRHERAKKEQAGARLIPQPDGMTMLGVTMTAQDGVRALAAINKAADRLRVPDDERTHGERQIEVVLDAVCSDGASAPAAGEGKPRRRRGTEVVATIDLLSLLKLRDAPGELAGYGPVSADQVRDMLAEPGSTLRRLVYEPVTGVLRDLGTARYEPDDAMRRLICARDVTCRAPGCTRNAVWCDIEHCDAFPYGSTSCANCGLMCRPHHNLKTHDGFSYVRPDPETGETVWKTPLGFVYRQSAASYTESGADLGDTVIERMPSPRGSVRPIGPGDGGPAPPDDS